MNVKTCEKEGCSNTFDIDNNEGTIVSKITNEGVTFHYYCCPGHRP